MKIERVKRALVTGCSGALGSYIHHELSADMVVLGQYHDNPVEQPAPGMARCCDLRNAMEVKELVETCDPQIVIHAAGVNFDGMTWKQPKRQWDETLEVNLTAAWLLSKYALTGMRVSGYGRIIFLSSVVGTVGIPGTAAYAASKAGLEGLARAMASEVASKGITVNVLRLGYVQTDNDGMLDRYSDAIKAKCLGRIPTKDFGTPDDVVKGIRYVIDSPWMTGNVVTLDGGMTTCQT